MRFVRLYMNIYTCICINHFIHVEATHCCSKSNGIKFNRIENEYIFAHLWMAELFCSLRPSFCSRYHQIHFLKWKTLKFVPRIPNNNKASFFQEMTWCQIGGYQYSYSESMMPLSNEPAMHSLLTHTPVTQHSLVSLKVWLRIPMVPSHMDSIIR